MKEKVLHNLFIEREDIQKSLLNILEIDENCEFVSEDQFPNGIYADFTIKKGNTVKAIVELKGSEIGVNDFVRGIGQILQYQHFVNQNMSLKAYNYSDASAILIFPSSIIKNKKFNLGLFNYPKGSKIIEINDYNHNLREVTFEELKHLANTGKNNNLVAISQYYIRDNRLFELYLCLKYLQIKKIQGCRNVNRKEAEEKFLMNLKTPNNKNWRNAFISLSSLNLIDKNNLPTIIGASYADKNYEDFVYEMYKSYINPYIDLMYEVLLKFEKNDETINASYKEIHEKIDEIFKQKKVLFFTESNNRYLSSWLNIMRDDFGCIDFNPHSNNRKLLYKVSDLNEEAVKENIRNKSIAYKYIEKFNDSFERR